MAQEFLVKEQILNGQKQSVAISQTNQVVSNAIQINADDSMLLAFQINASAVTGTAAIVKLQHSFDGVGANWTDVDATNAKVTLTAAGKFSLILNGYNSTFQSKLPLYRFIRFVCTTTGADTCTLSSIQVLVHA